MSESSGFFPDVSGDRTYTADFLALWIASIIGNGVYDGELAVKAGSNMQIVLPTGRAWINGYYYRNDGDLALSVGNADGVLNRKDAVVLRWDINARSITAQIIKGTPASSAAAPAITRTAEQFDLKVAEISVPAGTTAITQALITDTRLNKNVCGIVTGVVQQVDTTKLYQQIQNDLANFKSGSETDFSSWSSNQKSAFTSWESQQETDYSSWNSNQKSDFASWESQQKSDYVTWSATQQSSFQTWFNGIKGILGSDEAGNLMNRINERVEYSSTQPTNQSVNDIWIKPV